MNKYDMRKRIIFGLVLVVIILVGIIVLNKSIKLGAGVISLQTDNAKSITSTDIGDKSALDVNMAGTVGAILTKPTNIVTATTTGGTVNSTSTLYFKVTSIDYAGGQTTPTTEKTCTINSSESGSPTACTVTLTEVTGAASTRLWVGTSTGAYYSYQLATSSTLVATSVGLTAGIIPTTNTAYLNNNGSANYPLGNLISYITADALIKDQPGFIHTVTFSPSDAAATGGSIAICNNNTDCLSGTSTIFYVPTAAMLPVTITLDQYFSSGIYVDFTTTADVNVSVSYR